MNGLLINNKSFLKISVSKSKGFYPKTRFKLIDLLFAYPKDSTQNRNKKAFIRIIGKCNAFLW
ncbi:hypothetical protein BLOT_014266, partial [Blomia tropicalis]